MPLYERVLSLCRGYGISFPEKSLGEWADIFLSLEHLDTTWVLMLQDLKQATSVESLGEEWDIALEQLFSYFIYRHLAGGLEDGNYGERILFAVLGVYMISALWSLQIGKSETISFADFTEIARLYSSEIEYSEENTETLLLLL